MFPRLWIVHAILRAVHLAGANVDVSNGTSGYTPLMFACQNGHVEAATSLIDAGTYLDAKTKDGGRTALHLAALSCLAPVVRKLLANGAAPDVRDARGETALHIGCGIGSHEVVHELVQGGAEFDGEGHAAHELTPLECCCVGKNGVLLEGHFAAAEVLLKAGARVGRALQRLQDSKFEGPLSQQLEGRLNEAASSNF